jgi:hypothetical protein
LYKAEIQKYVDRCATCEANKDKAFALIFAQCNKTLQNKILSSTDYEVDVKGDPIELLNVIEEHAMSFQEHKYDALVVFDSLKGLFNLKQKDDEDLVDYVWRFKSARDVLESHVGEKMRFKKLAKAEAEWSVLDVDAQEQCYEQA